MNTFVRVRWVLFVFSILFFHVWYEAQANTDRRIVAIENDGPGAQVRFDDQWKSLAKSRTKALSKVIHLLSQSEIGAELVRLARKRAFKSGHLLSEVILPGRISVTDTTLIRKFSIGRPDKIHYHTKSRVYLGVELSVLHGVLDLAHELIHYIYRPQFNPYQNSFNISHFIKSTIEGRGGEVEAYITECRVFFELMPEKAKQSKCMKVYDPLNKKFSKAMGISEFYKMGGYLPKFKQRLHQHGLKMPLFPLALDADPLFISSAYGVPYPLAAAMEYDQIMSKVCVNDQKRLGLIEERLSSVRRLASANLKATLRKNRIKLSKSVHHRCHTYLSQN